MTSVIFKIIYFLDNADLVSVTCFMGTARNKIINIALEALKKPFYSSRLLASLKLSVNQGFHF